MSAHRSLALVAAAALALAGCANRSFEVGSLQVAAIRDYSGRCGDPPHGTAYRVLSCEVQVDDAPSGGDWRFACY